MLQTAFGVLGIQVPSACPLRVFFFFLLIHIQYQESVCDLTEGRWTGRQKKKESETHHVQQVQARAEHGPAEVPGRTRQALQHRREHVEAVHLSMSISMGRESERARARQTEGKRRFLGLTLGALSEGNLLCVDRSRTPGNAKSLVHGKYSCSPNNKTSLV